MSPRNTARIAGYLYLIIIVTAWIGEFFIRGRLVVSGNAAATAANILSGELLYRLAGLIDFVVLACDTAIAVLLYVVLKPVSVAFSLIAAAFRIVFAAIQGVGMLFHFAPLYMLKDAPYSGALTTAQWQAISMLSLRLHGTVFLIALLFFAVHCVLIGILIARSKFLPRVIGLGLAVAGVGYLLNSGASLFLPALRPFVFPYVLFLGLFAEGAFALWLAFMGLNSSAWEKQATRHRQITAA